MLFDQITNNRRYLFWTLQAVGWSGWAFTFYLGVLFWGKLPSENYHWYLPLISFIGMCFTLGLRALYRSMWEMHIVRRVVAIVVGSYTAGLLWMACRAAIFYEVFPNERRAYEEHGMAWYSYFDGGISAFWVMLVWSALYFGIKYYLQSQEEKERWLKAVNMAHQAQLKMLRYQLNPHFLFNTLNAISTLILDKNTELANSMVTRLSRFLRYSLDNDPMQKVTVAQEMDALRLYLDIEKVRFEERLELHFDVEPSAETGLMPSLLLQPLVENSIKYAIAQAINGGAIAISARVFGNDLLLSVADDGPGLDLRNGRLPKGGGVGLANCRERLKEIYGEHQSFRLSTTEPHGLTINIRIPLERETKAP
ncbi:sensor histidine kinase [Parahaliea mediterranea]|uniref:sensor histidine kinase n=1 Tax=Parahaliea mediterranea TaxID=651086 RepID=UPI000E2FBFF8|nr:histidine kinase [Parahaliea mediterranea]